MAKKKYSRDISTKYNRYEKQENKLENNGKNDSSKFQNTDDLDSTRNLDISFVEGKFSKRAVEEKTEVLDVSEIVKANNDFNAVKANNSFKVIICILGAICFLLLIFIICHFIIFDHNKVKVIEREVTKEVMVVDDNYLFLGDSITEWYDLDKYYSNLPVVNSGISGYTTSSILENLDKMVYKYNPSKVFILIGINDLELKVSNDVVVDNIKKIIKNIKNNRRYSKIYIESIYPINNSDNEVISYDVINGNRKNADILEINEKLVKLADEEDITYIDVYSELIDDDGLLKLEYTIDGLHLSDDGYKKVTEVLKKYVRE